jgi:hypothetical protein
MNELFKQWWTDPTRTGSTVTPEEIFLAGMEVGKLENQELLDIAHKQCAFLMNEYQEHDKKMQEAWSAYKARELYLQNIIDKIHWFTEDATAIATPAPETYLGRKIKDEHEYN